MENGTIDTVETARALRERARKARRMARGLPDPDGARLQAYAEELDARASELERGSQA
jgi:hypothetical protein